MLGLDVMAQIRNFNIVDKAYKIYSLNLKRVLANIDLKLLIVSTLVILKQD